MSSIGSSQYQAHLAFMLQQDWFVAEQWPNKTGWRPWSVHPQTGDTVACQSHFSRTSTSDLTTALFNQSPQLSLLPGGKTLDCFTPKDLSRIDHL